MGQCCYLEKLNVRLWFPPLRTMEVPALPSSEPGMTASLRTHTFPAVLQGQLSCLLQEAGYNTLDGRRLNLLRALVLGKAEDSCVSHRMWSSSVWIQSPISNSLSLCKSPNLTPSASKYG